jgi:SAM-dependent methyltransferase
MMYVFTDDPTERIRAAEELLDEGTARVLDRVGVGAGWKCLEVGAGGGSVARWMADRVGASGHVVATDLDTRGLSSESPVLEIRQHDIVADPLESSQFDLIHARLVLEHLSAREQVLEKLVSALRPGGWLVVEDVDYVSGVPISDLGAAEHARTQAVRLETFGKSGVDHVLGRRLPTLLRSAGLVEVGNEGRAWVMEGGSPGARWFKLSMAHLRGRLVGPEGLSDAEVDRMLELFDDPDWSAFSPIVVAAWGQRTRMSSA